MIISASTQSRRCARPFLDWHLGRQYCQERNGSGISFSLSFSVIGKKLPTTGEVHIWVKECLDLPLLRGSHLNSFVKWYQHR